MRVLIVNDRVAEREAMVRALQPSVRQVDGAGDVKSALSMVRRESVEVIIFAWPNVGGTEMVRELRGLETTANAYVVTVIDSLQPARAIAMALSAGVHDFLRRPVFNEELVARVNAPARLLRWAKSLTKTDLYDWTGGLDLRRLRAWTEMGAIVAEDLSQMIGLPLDAVEGWPKNFDQALRGASIPMSLPSEQTELRVSIVADTVTLAWLSRTLIGDPNAETLAQEDCLREMANVAGGAVKRAALPDVALTMGIPVSTGGLRPTGDTSRCWALPLAAEGCCMAIVGEIRRRDNLRIPALQLREGMVVVNDVRNQAGALLVNAGTRLTATTAERVAQILGRRFVVEVSCAA
jgi:DNA-binding response OmpR family regulator